MSPLSREELLRLAALLLQEAAQQPSAGPALGAAQPPPPPCATLPQYVTLDQAAAWVSRSKRTLEKYRSHRKSPLPEPAIEGGAGQPHLWSWPVMRSWLEGVFHVTLPERLPEG